MYTPEHDALRSPPHRQLRVRRHRRAVDVLRESFAGAVLLLFFIASPAGAQVLPLVSYTPQDVDNPLPSADVRSTFQDSLGYVWMAVYSSGMVRYNGSSYDLFTKEDGLRSAGVGYIMSDRAGRLWISSDQGLSVTVKPLQEYTEGSRVRFTSRLGETDLLGVTVPLNMLVVDQKGRIWAGTNSLGIVRYTYEAPDVVIADTIRTSLSNDGENITVRSLFVRNNGTIYAGLINGDILAFDEETDQFERIFSEPEAAGQSLIVFHETPESVVWGGTNSGVLMRLDEAGDRPVMRIILPDLGGTISGMISTSSGRMWISSEGVGLLSVDPSAENLDAKLYTRTNGLLSENVHHVMIDREGNLWISQSGGVSKLRFDYAAFRHITERSYVGEKPRLPSSYVSSMNIPGNSGGCELWAGTQDAGIACLRDNGESIYIQETDGLRSNQVHALTIDEKGRLWVGTYSGINGVSFSSTLTLPPAAQTTDFQFDARAGRIAGYRGTSIYSIAKRPFPVDQTSTQSVESLWFPGFKSIYLLIEDRWYVFRAATGLPSTTYIVVELDDAGYLWVGTLDEGIYRSRIPLTLEALNRMDKRETPYSLDDRQGTFGVEIVSPLFERVWSIEEGAPTNQIQALRSNHGAMWIGTPEGIFVMEGYSPANLYHLTTKDGLRSNNVNSMDFSPFTGSLWAGTNRGLVEIDPVAKTVVRQITKQDGLIGEESWYYGSVVVDERGSVYYGTANGITIYDQQHDVVNELPPRLQIQLATYTENGRGGNEFFVQYAGLSFVNEKQVQYRTRLLGYETEWSPVTREVKIRYTNLPAYVNDRTYTFEMQASNNDGIWTPAPLAYSFEVKPALWFRWWAMLIYLFALGVIFFLADRIQSARLIKKERARAEIEKARELQSINTELQQTLDHLTETRDQLIHAEKMASMGQLTSGIAHEIKNPLNFVNNFANLNLEIVGDFVKMLDEDSYKSPQEIALELKDQLADMRLNSEKILMYGERADHIVESMMMHARPRSNRKEPTAINLLVEEYIGIAYHSMQVQAPDFESLIEQHYDEKVGALTVIPHDLGHVLLNLYQNAFQAMYEKKKEDASYRPLLTISTKKNAKNIEIRVSDNGPGIPDQVRDKVFEPFYTTRPAGSGVGLGLSISYDIIVQGHKGSITVESSPGSGTTMIVTLPA